MISRSISSLILGFAAGIYAMPAFNASQLVPRQALTSSGTGTSNGYYYSFYTDGTDQVTYTNLAGGEYSLNWNGGGDVVAGKGWNPGGPM